MTTKASATATVDSAVESPKRVKASTKKSTRKSTSRSAKTAATPPIAKKPAAKKPAAKKSASGTKKSGTKKTAVVESTLAAVVEKPKPAPRKQRAASRSGTSGSRKRATETCLSELPIEEIWSMYREEQTQDVRNFLIEKYHDLVRFTAERMAMRLPSEVDTHDLMQAGSFGLMDAINAFDPGRNVKFETYCTQRIRGAIFDELRSMDWVPRLVRSRTSKFESTRKQIEMETGRAASDDEIADRLQLPPEEYRKLKRDSRPVTQVSLNRKWFETDSSKDVREIDVVKDTRQENPLTAVQRQDLQSLLTKGLSRAERLIVILYYYEEMTMKEIGITLDLSESRVSQMHSSILARLKAQMQHREREF